MLRSNMDMWLEVDIDSFRLHGRIILDVICPAKVEYIDVLGDWIDFHSFDEGVPGW